MNFKSFLLSILLLHVSTATIVELEKDIYQLEWHTNEERTEVTFTVTVKTTGWVGLGFSSNGAMTKADIVIGGVKDGAPYFNDYHGPSTGNSMPIQDAHNDYQILESNENGTHTMLKFKRLTSTCDPDDMAITDAGLRLIWAYGQTDDIGYHGETKGTKSAYILDPDLPIVDLTPFNTTDITSKIQMPKVQTTYWCSMHRLPDLEHDHQMIAYEPIFISNNSRTFAHHMNILKCWDYPGSDEAYDKFVDHPGVNCNQEEEMGFPGSTCVFLEYGWALGGELAVNPKDIGFPFKSRQYYKLEVHLNNPNGAENEEVEVGFRIYHTPERQKIQGSLLMVSAPSNYQLMVPPNATEFTTVAHCMPQCLNQIPSVGITAYNAFLHAHTSARKMRIRHYRNGVELPWIINDENYDFNYQTNRRLPKEVTILPGDQITAECVYDTHWKKGKGVLGGSSTDDEMCMVFIAYYPAIDNFVGCYDWMNKFNMYKMLGVETVDKPTAKNPTVTAPSELAGKRFSQVVDEFPWTDELRREYQWQHQHGEHVTACLPMINAVTGYYPHVEKYEPEDVCSGQSTNTAPDSTTSEHEHDTTKHEHDTTEHEQDTTEHEHDTTEHEHDSTTDNSFASRLSISLGLIMTLSCFVYDIY